MRILDQMVSELNDDDLGSRNPAISNSRGKKERKEGRCRTMFKCKRKTE